MKRTPRPEPKRGRPWAKATTPLRSSPSQGGESNHARIMRRLQAAVESQRDAAALVQLVREYCERSMPIPKWVPEALESCLTDFVNLANERKARATPGPWVKWARKWPRRYLDGLIAMQITDNLEFYGLTWDEALDEASCCFDGTPAAGSPDAMMKAYRRDKKDGAQRPRTKWEIRSTSGTKVDYAYASEWWAANADLKGAHEGEWLKRPRLLKPRRQR
jgi:hypothetical protein